MNWFKSFWEALTTPSAASRPMENFTPHAQQLLALARKEADRFHHNFVGTEHLLLGLISLGQGRAVTILAKLGLDLHTVRNEVEKQVGTGPDQKMTGNIPYTPRVKKVLAIAAKEAQALNHNYLGTEHILLGLLVEGDGVAGRVLKHLGVDIEKTRLEILKDLDPNYAGTAMDIQPPEKRQKPNLSDSKPGSIDTRNRYDVYCRERDQQVVVYRNALFKRRTKLLSTREHDFGAEFLELEQSNGQLVCLSLHSVIKFCEHGTEIIGEILPPAQ